MDALSAHRPVSTNGGSDHGARYIAPDCAGQNFYAIDRGLRELFNRLREVARRHDRMMRAQLSEDEVQRLGDLLERLEAGVAGAGAVREARVEATR